MTLPAIYISLHLLTVILLFIKGDWSDKYKRTLIVTHFVLLSFILFDIFVFNLKGVLLDRLIVVAFLLTASTTFALYRQTLKLWQKLYFGFFLFYPIIAAATFLIDRVMFIVVASPLLVTLTIPVTKFSSKEYDLREIVGAMAPVQLALVKKGLIIEKHLGASNDEQITHKAITGLTIIRVTVDTTIALVKSGDKSYEIAFHK
jgi:hypothetical protein